jgi:hypothetical protein
MSRSATVGIWSLVALGVLALGVFLFPGRIRSALARATGACESVEQLGEAVITPCRDRCHEEFPADPDRAVACFEPCAVLAINLRMQAKPECADYWLNAKPELAAK